MNTEEKAAICRELAEAMGYTATYFQFRTNPQEWRIYPPNSPNQPLGLRIKPTEKEAWQQAYDTGAINFFENWNATGALIEWWTEAFAGLHDMFLCQPLYSVIECQITEYSNVPTLARETVGNYLGTGKTRQEAIVRAIHAAWKARKEARG